MNLQNKNWVIGLLLVTLTSVSSGQVYKVVIMSSKSLFDLEFVSLEDSTLTMTREGELFTIPIKTITQIERKGSSGTSMNPAEKADLHIFRGLVMGTLSTGVGVFIGAGVGLSIGSIIGMEGEQILLPMVIGAGVGGATLALLGTIYFLTEDFGSSPNYHDITDLPLHEKHRQLELIFRNGQP